ncbi:MAG: hypothetical protein WD267_08370 [Balneolales bacterium]
MEITELLRITGSLLIYAAFITMLIGAIVANFLRSTEVSDKNKWEPEGKLAEKKVNF